MESLNNKQKIIFRIISLGIFVTWCFLLLSMDAYLFSDISSIGFWIAGIKRVFLASIFSVGLMLVSTHFGQKYKVMSILSIFISLVASLFLVTTNLCWIFWGILACIHLYAILIILK